MEPVRQAAEHHYTDLPYHNFQHVKDALFFAETLIERCEDHNIDVDETVIRYALYFHDAGYHRDHEAKGFASKEAYSAHIAEDELNHLDTAPDTIADVKSCILATEPEKTPTTAEQKIVRAADLAAMGKTYSTFRDNTEKLREEEERLQGRNIPETEWIEDVKDTIAFYLDQDIRLTPEHDEHGISRFHARTRHNLRRFLEEHGEEPPQGF